MVTVTSEQSRTSRKVKKSSPLTMLVVGHTWEVEDVEDVEVVEE